MGGAPGPILSENELGPAPVCMIGSFEIFHCPCLRLLDVPVFIWVYNPPRSSNVESFGRNNAKYLVSIFSGKITTLRMSVSTIGPNRVKEIKSVVDAMQTLTLLLIFAW